MFKATNFVKMIIIFVGAVVILFSIMLTPEFFRETTLIAEHIQKSIPLFGIINYWFIAGLYGAVIPFIIMLFKILQIVKLIEERRVFSNKTVKFLRQIRNQAMIMGSSFMIGIMPLITIIAELDDAPGLFVIGFAIGLTPFFIVALIAILQSLLKEAIEYKSNSNLSI